MGGAGKKCAVEQFKFAWRGETSTVNGISESMFQLSWNDFPGRSMEIVSCSKFCFI